MFESAKKQSESLTKIDTLGYTEQKTPKAGYILLLAMAIASTFFGWRALDDLADVPAKPELLSSCAYEFVQINWEDVGRFNHYQYTKPAYFDDGPYGLKPEKLKCVFSDTETKYGIAAIYENREALNLRFDNIMLELQKTENYILDYERQYSLGLSERIANEQKLLYPPHEIQARLEPLRKQKAELETQADSLRINKKSLHDELKARYKSILPELRRHWRLYEFKVFLLEIIFAAPFFFIVFRFYRRFLLNKSPYTIIFTALLLVASVFMLRVLLKWFWSLFLARVLQTLWVFIQNFALLKSLVFYGGMVLSIVIFGGAVYLLQKHIFNSKRIAARSLQKNMCPQCGITLSVAGEFCPNCGRRIREKCGACGKTRYVDFNTCPQCGIAKNSE